MLRTKTALITIVVAILITATTSSGYEYPDNLTQGDFFRLSFDSTLTRQTDEIDSLFSCLIVDGKVKGKDMEKFCNAIFKFVYLKTTFDGKLVKYGLETITIGPSSGEATKMPVTDDRILSKRQLAVVYQRPLIIHGAFDKQKITNYLITHGNYNGKIVVEECYQTTMLIVLILISLGSLILASLMIFKRPFIYNLTTKRATILIISGCVCVITSISLILGLLGII